MAKIKTVKKLKSVSRKNPILNHAIQKQKPSRVKTTHTSQKTRSVAEVFQDVKRYIKFFSNGGVTVKTALKFSLKVDIERARTQLKAFYITGLRSGIFRFRVKSSGLYVDTPKSYEVDIHWVTDGLIGHKTSKEIFKNAPIKAQCSCGRHTYWYRYMWTKAGASLGLQEHRFPSVRNKSLDGMCCKHIIKVLDNLEKPHFQATFKRYVSNLEQGKRTNISYKDKAKIAGAGFGTQK